jgi:hypothetical protein
MWNAAKAAWAKKTRSASRISYRLVLQTRLSLIERLQSQLRPGDWLVAFLFVALAAGSFWLGGRMNTSEQAAGNLIAVVMVGNRQLTTRDLAAPSDFAVRGAVGEMLLQVANRRIRILRSACPNQVCVRQGAAYRPGEILVCVPNRVVIFIRRANEATFTQAPGDSTTSDKPTSDTLTSDYDAVTY